MAIELWANNAYSTLASGISSGDLSLTVASGHGARFRSVGSDFYFLTLDDGANIEIVKVTARSTDTFTIVRAQQGTSATSFSTGTSIEQRLTRETLEILQSGGAPTNADYLVETANGSLSAEVVTGTTFITTAAYASRQAAAKAGRLFLPNDGFVLERDTGSAWAPWGPLYQFTAPDNSLFSDYNSPSSIVTTNGAVHQTFASTATTQFRGRTKTKTAPYTITAAFLPLFYPGNYVRIGLFFTDGTKTAVFGVAYNTGVASTPLICSSKYTNATNISADYSIVPWSYYSSVLWLRIADDNSNRICSFSSDGINFTPFHSIGRTDFLTATSVGWGGDIENSHDGGLTLLSWKET